MNLCYNIGKWIYLIDALDDLEKDYARKTTILLSLVWADSKAPPTLSKKTARRWILCL